MAKAEMKSGRPSEVFGAVRDLGPGELFELLEQCAALLPAEVRYRLRGVMASAGSGGDNLHRALEIVRAQWEGLRAQESVKVAVVGPARTGKSSLIAALGEGNVDRVAGLFTLVDLQGLDEFLGYGKRSSIAEELAGFDVVLFVLDGSAGFTEETTEMVCRFSFTEKSFLLLLNKMDRVESPRKVTRLARETFGTSVIPVSVRRPESLKRVLRAIVSANPRALYPLTQHLPSFRRSICGGIVSQAAFATGLIGALPIPVGDILPISAIQTAMILKIARACGLRISRGRARELLPVLTAGLLVREGCHRLKEMFPDQRRFISVSVGGVWTYLIGLATIRYFERMALVLEADTD